LIGCGFVSAHHIEAWSRIPAAEIVAVCDRDTARLEAAAARIPSARRYVDAAELLASERDLAFVEICTLAETHRELVRLAAEHRVHVLCQKPAANEREDLLAMIADCERAGVRLMIHENWRFRAWYRALKALIDDGKIGRPIRLRISHRDTRALRPDGYDQQPYLARMPRLILMDMGCHVVDTARYLLGEIKTVFATVGRFGEKSQGEDVAVLATEFTSGAIGTLDLSWCSPVEPERSRPEWALNETIVEGTGGSLRVLPSGSIEWRTASGDSELIAVALPDARLVYGQAYESTQRHFIEGLLAGAEHETSGADNLKTMDVVWAAYASAELGRKLLL
jgi:predicted dehydrogenase